MKKIFYILLAVIALNINQAKAQNIPKPGSNIKNQTLDKFAGAWIWTKGNDTLRIKLKKENIAMPAGLDFSSDVIVGYHQYKKGNNIISDSFNYYSQKYSGKTTPILAGLNQTGDTLNGFFHDKAKNKAQHLEVMISKDRKTLSFTLKETEGLKVGAKKGSSIPVNMVFVKEK